MADEKVAPEGVEAPKKSKMMMVVVVVLLLGMGGFAFMYFTGKGGDSEESASAETDSKKKKKAPARMPGETGPLVDIASFVVNLQGEEGMRYLKVELTVELDSEESVEPFTKVMSITRNEILMTLSGLDAESTKTAKARRKLEKKIKKAINKRLGTSMVEGIFFTEFVMQ